MSGWHLGRAAVGLSEVPSAEQEPATGDRRLALSRRIDWRFLLPDPGLGEVAYIGPASGSLPEALQAFSRSFLRLEDHLRGGARPAGFDLVVAPADASRGLGWLAECLRPGGSLLLEGGLERRASRFRWRAPVCTRALQNAGLVDVRAYWHWPGLESGLEIAPLDDRAALALALSRRRSGWRARVQGQFARGLVALGLWPWLVSSFTVIGRRPA